MQTPKRLPLPLQSRRIHRIQNIERQTDGYLMKNDLERKWKEAVAA
jgi:hypothetical protein